MTDEFLDANYRIVTQGDWPNLRPARFRPFGVIPKMVVLPKDYYTLTEKPSTYRYTSPKYLKRLIKEQDDKIRNIRE